MKNLQINNNGNPREQLMEEVQRAKEAADVLEEAMHALTYHCFHGRNYQTRPEPASARNADIAAWREQAAKVSGIQAYLEDCLIQLDK